MQLSLERNEWLLERLDACVSHDAEYNRGLSDHLPMLLHALHALGAAPARLTSYAAQYAARLEPRRVVAIEIDDWRALRGNIDAYDSLAKYFAGRISAEGRDQVLRETLPPLMPGVAAGAFHGLIRCGHALAAQHDGELANGLAYWVSAWLPLLPGDTVEGREPLPAPTIDLTNWVRSAHDLHTTLDTEPPRITLRMKAWSAAPQFPTLASALRCDENTLDAMARFAAALYAQTGNFTVMHMVTSAHALLTLRPWLGDVSLATRWFGVALLAAIRAARLTPAQIEAGLALLGDADAVAALPVQPWAALAAIVIDSDHDHAAKIVYSSRALFEMFGHPVLHAAATKGMLTQARWS